MIAPRRNQDVVRVSFISATKRERGPVQFYISRFVPCRLFSRRCFACVCLLWVVAEPCVEVSELSHSDSASHSTTAPKTTYSDKAPAKRRRRAPAADREAARRVPRRPEVGRPPNPRALSHPRGSREGNGGLGRWSADPQAAPHSHIELIAMFRHQCLWLQMVAWGGVGWPGW